MKRTITRLLGAAALALFLAPAGARADECKKVDFGVQNNFKVKIRATKMEYMFAEDGKARTEAFANTEVEPGKFKTVAKDQNLAGGEGNKLKWLKLHFQAWCGGKWTGDLVGKEDSSFDDTSTCKSSSGRSYRYDTNTTDICNTL